MPPTITEALKALGKRVLEAYILAPLLTALPPAALWLFARDFVTSSHSIPGVVMLVASALAGLLVVSVGFNVAHWQRQRKRRRRNLTLVAHGGLASGHWQVWPGGMTIAVGVFDITNLTPADITVPRTILQISRPRFGLIPRWRSFHGPLGLHDVIPAGGTLRDQQLRFDIPPGEVGPLTSFRARVGLVDNFGACNWGTWETWERALQRDPR